MKVKPIQSQDVAGKNVLVRLDLDVPLNSTGHIKDPVRLESGKETIDWLLKHGAHVIVIGHLGRPAKEFSISNFQLPISNENKKYMLWWVVVTTMI